jgi:signal recognition particle receptor subunit beta
VHATDPQPRTNARIVPVKFVVAGGFGVGKTTFVGAISEIDPLRTEAAMTSVSTGVDDLTHVSQKTTTTVAMDFGRITVDETLVMYLFGTPGQERFGFMWDDLCTGALGAVVLVDTRRIDQCFPAIDYFEAKQIPFVVGVNAFEGAPRYAMSEVVDALGVGSHVPVIDCDARHKESVKQTLITLLESLVAQARAREGVA